MGPGMLGGPAGSSSAHLCSAAGRDFNVLHGSLFPPNSLVLWKKKEPVFEYYFRINSVQIVKWNF